MQLTVQTAEFNVVLSQIALRKLRQKESKKRGTTLLLFSVEMRKFSVFCGSTVSLSIRYMFLGLIHLC